jgi:enoyl-CoA hydratase
MEFAHLLIEQRDAVRLLYINRPKVLNALNSEVLDEIEVALMDALGDASVRGIILTGSGEKAFVAGADITEFTDMTWAQTVAMSQRGQRLYGFIENAAKPVVAAVNGYALGGGCELALACHMRTASENTRFGLPEVKLGLIPGYGGTQRLARLVGRPLAIELMLSAEMIDGVRAQALGLVNHNYPAAELIDQTVAFLNSCLRYSATSIKHILQSVHAGIDDAARGYQTEAELFAQSMVSHDGREGVAAFLEKRKPNFKANGVQAH